MDLSRFDLSRARRAPMPTDVAPMLATLTHSPFSRPGWIFEIKWDGFRAIAEVRPEAERSNGHRSAVRLYSRHQVGYEDEFPAIVKDLETIGFPAIVDGEIVVVDEEGRASFKLLQRYRRTGKGRLLYYLFDLLYFDGYDLRGMALAERKAILKGLLPDLPRVRYSDHVAEEGMALFEQAAANDVEGVIAKDGDSPYRSGVRSKEWLKFKARLSAEAVIGGFTAPQGSRHAFGALLLGAYRGDELIYVGHTGSGFDEEDLAEVHSRLEKLTTDRMPFRSRPPTNAPPTWVEPELVCEVRFASWTEAGVMRQAIFAGLRDDADPREVQRELPSGAQQARRRRRYSIPALRSRERKRETIEVAGQEVTVSSLEKVYWPEEKILKGDVIDYYRRMAPLILPYLVDRPQSLHRFPNGIAGKDFYQKDMDFAPAWAQTERIRAEETGEWVDYLVCQDAATLVFMANLGCIELNPWNSRLGHLERPDYLAIDLDPLEIGFDAVIRVAREVHAVLEAIGVVHLVKTSGATGMHVFVPLGAQYTYEQAHQFGFLIGHLIRERLPEITSLERSPQARRGKVYLDLLQNRIGQTMTAPYSLRPRPGAPVSTPLRWEEVRPGLSPANFTIGNIRERVNRVGDLWRGVLGPGIEMMALLDRLKGEF